MKNQEVQRGKSSSGGGVPGNSPRSGESLLVPRSCAQQLPLFPPCTCAWDAQWVGAWHEQRLPVLLRNMALLSGLLVLSLFCLHVVSLGRGLGEAGRRLGKRPGVWGKGEGVWGGERAWLEGGPPPFLIPFSTAPSCERHGPLGPAGTGGERCDGGRPKGPRLWLVRGGASPVGCSSSAPSFLQLMIGQGQEKLSPLSLLELDNQVQAGGAGEEWGGLGEEGRSSRARNRVRGVALRPERGVGATREGDLVPRMPLPLRLSLLSLDWDEALLFLAQGVWGRSMQNPGQPLDSTDPQPVPAGAWWPHCPERGPRRMQGDPNPGADPQVGPGHDGLHQGPLLPGGPKLHQAQPRPVASECGPGTVSPGTRYCGSTCPNQQGREPGELATPECTRGHFLHQGHVDIW